MLNTAEEKLGWIFTAFDADGGGTIDVEEIRFCRRLRDYLHVICFYSVFVLHIRDIVVGLFRLAGLEEDEDLLYACTMDVR